MSLVLPQRNLAEWADELITECRVSSSDRRSLIKMYRSYYYTGASDGQVTTYNRCYPHIERLSAYLFSSTDARFDIQFDEEEDEEIHKMGHAGARVLNREFHSRNLDTSFSSAVTGGLIDGCNILKGIWGHNGLEGWVVRPQFFGVLREDIDDLDRQEAFVHSTYLTLTALERTLADHPEKASILEAVKSAQQTNTEKEEMQDDYFHQIIVGGTQPVSTTTSSGSGMVGITGVPTPSLSEKVAASLVRIDELWVQDRERQDYTTIRYIKPNILVEGKFKRRNLSGLTDTLGKDSELKGHHPFIKVCPNSVEGYFWGQSEIANIYKLQDDLNDQISQIKRITRVRADPPRSAVGFAGMTLEKYKAFKRPGGFVAEENPTAKLSEHAPELPPELFTRLDKTIAMFDDVAGFTPILQGQGETGVRSQSQANTLARNASPRMRDRALLVERQCTEWGDFLFKMLQAKEAEVQKGGKNQEFLLSQLPDDAKIMIDSHTSSPVYQEDAEKKAFNLHKAGAIDNAALIMLTHPPHEDMLISQAQKRAEAQQKMVQEHPELLTKGKKR